MTHTTIITHDMATPVGVLRLVVDGDYLVRIEFGAGESGQPGNKATAAAASRALLKECERQLQEYFEGHLRQFDLPLRAAGTAFQQEVWDALRTIPYGEVCSYGDIARAIQRPRAVRAVGAANGRNPLPIVVPCHRVIGSNGSLTGFAGGLAMKTQLLQLEGALLI
tara:strand:+ start:18446 stop:18943 length:498 start_codon:yes stop_codon:yes gene_type:complete